MVTRHGTAQAGNRCEALRISAVRRNRGARTPAPGRYVKAAPRGGPRAEAARGRSGSGTRSSSGSSAGAPPPRSGRSAGAQRSAPFPASDGANRARWVFRIRGGFVGGEWGSATRGRSGDLRNGSSAAVAVGGTPSRSPFPSGSLCLSAKEVGKRHREARRAAAVPTAGTNGPRVPHPKGFSECTQLPSLAIPVPPRCCLVPSQCQPGVIPVVSWCHVQPRCHPVP